MAEIINGFDDRDWNGVLSEQLAAYWKFVGIKVSQGQGWYPSDRAVLQLQWKRANKNYGLLRIPFHFYLQPTFYTEPIGYGINQALNFYNTMRDENNADVQGWGELPPAIDMENKFIGMAGAEARALCFKACLDKTEELWDRRPMIYTAGWIWNSVMHDEFEKLVPEYWKVYDLWEADPPPDTDIKGWGKTNSIQQVNLDGYYPGYGSGAIDLDETTQAWIDKVTAVSLPPNPEPVPVPDPEPIPDPVDPGECESCRELKKRAAEVVLAVVSLSELL